MPKNSEKKKVIGIPESIYLEIEKYACSKKPQLFLYEVIVDAWKEYKKKKK